MVGGGPSTRACAFAYSRNAGPGSPSRLNFAKTVPAVKTPSLRSKVDRQIYRAHSARIPVSDPTSSTAHLGCVGCQPSRSGAERRRHFQRSNRRALRRSLNPRSEDSSRIRQEAHASVIAARQECRAARGAGLCPRFGVPADGLYRGRRLAVWPIAGTKTETKTVVPSCHGRR